VLDRATNSEFWVEAGGDLSMGERASELWVATVGDCVLSVIGVCECEWYMGMKGGGSGVGGEHRG